MAYINNTHDVIEILLELRSDASRIKNNSGVYEGNLANRFVGEIWDVHTWLENRTDNSDDKLKDAMEPVMKLRGEAKAVERDMNNCNNKQLAEGIVTTLYDLMLYVAQNKKEIDLKDSELREKMNQQAQRGLGV